MKRKINFIIIVVLLSLIGFLGYNMYTSSESDIFSRLDFMNKEQKPKIAYVHVKKVYENHPAKKLAERELENMAREVESELNERLEDLPGTEQQQLMDKYQQELSRNEDEFLDQIMLNINNVINKIAAENEVRLVLNKKNVVFGGYDLTQKVINYIDDNIDPDQVLEKEELNLELELLQE